MVCAGSVAILLPAWLPNGSDIPFAASTVELLQAALLAGSSIVLFGAAAHAKLYRPACRVLGLILFAAFIGEIEDFIHGIMGWNFPDKWIIGLALFAALITSLRHKREMVSFAGTLGQHAGAGFIAAALIILYVFNRVIGSEPFWRATLGEDFSPKVPHNCRSYLELLACYLLFIGSLGLSITFARRKDRV